MAVFWFGSMLLILFSLSSCKEKLVDENLSTSWMTLNSSGVQSTSRLAGDYSEVLTPDSLIAIKKN